MESISQLSSLTTGEVKPEEYILPHYKESYRLAIDALVDGGRKTYQEFLTNEKLGDFLSEEELAFITQNAEKPPQVNPLDPCEDIQDDSSSTGTYWPVESDVETPDLDIGWPGFLPELSKKTNVDLYFHPPRQNCPTIKEVIRKSIQDARKVIAIVMDVFTDVDIFKEIVDASVRGVPAYILLDEFQFKSFLTMAEKQGVQVQRLRNMRVRTIKGQEYLCRSGAKFHGALEQKFLLVDCHTVVYGSYSFMWSFEKINLSMVQVITGQLVECYDEEFRTLFARSTIPNILAPENVTLDVKQERWQNGTNTVSSYVSHSQPFDKRDKLRHTLDTVYMKACGRQLNVTNNMGDMDNNETYQQRTFGYRPGPTGLNVQNRIQQLQSTETSNYLKRHSYAGEKQETPLYVQNRASNFGSSNWNAGREHDGYGAPGRTDFKSKYNAFQGGGGEQFQKGRLTQPYRSNMRKSFHGTDNHVRTLQQNMPTLERTTKSFLRTWRIESYLNNSESPLEDCGDYPAAQYDGLEGIENKPNQMYPVHSRLRSSLVFKSTIPEQLETNSYASNSNLSSSTMGRSQDKHINSSANVYYPAVHRNPSMQTENRMRQDDFVQKRRSLQIYDDQKTHMNYAANKESFTPMYATLGRTSAKNPDVLHQVEGYGYKRQSINEPKPSQDYSANKDNSSYMYGTLGRREPDKYVTSQGNNHTQNKYALQNLDGQRSTSQHNVKMEAENKTLSTSNWQPPPSRTVSATSLADSRQEEQNAGKANKESEGSPRFFKRSTKKIKSLLNLTDKSPKSKRSSNLKISDSSDTLVSDDEDQKHKTNKENNKLSTSTANSVKSIDSLGHTKINQKLQLKENHFSEKVADSSAPRFSTEQLNSETDKEQKTSAVVSPATSSTVVHHPPETRKVHPENSSAVSQALQRNRPIDKRVYSRFESFCTFENHSSKPTDSREQTVTTGAMYTAEKNKNVISDYGRTNAASAHHTPTGYQTYSHNDNKIGRFMQRFVGNFIHKHK